MLMNATTKAVACIAAMLFAAGGAVGEITIETVPVGNPGNPADTAAHSGNPAGQGSVSYAYYIAKYEVTSGQYCAFLNAVAKTDTYGLYNEWMDTVWGWPNGCNIKRTGAPGTYSYNVPADWADRPVNYVSYWDACRFANWLQNGQPNLPAGLGTTETGAYTMNGYTGRDGRDIQRNADWTWAVTSEDEWYKAAHHKNDGVTGDYWNHATGTNIDPSNALIDPDPGNNANYFNVYEGGFTIDSPYYRTIVGEFENSKSSYGTFDQNGNVEEWNEEICFQDVTVASRGFRGGSWAANNDYIHSYTRGYCPPNAENSSRGFRVVSLVPEPTSLALVAAGAYAFIRPRKSPKRR